MKTLVVGAGISGLVVAKELIKAGRSVVLIEPRARVGGRILTRASRAHHFPVDLGPEFVHGNPPETRALVPDAEGEIIRLRERQRVFWDDQIRDYDTERSEKIFGALGERVPDRSVAVALAELELDPLNQAMTTAFAEGFNAADVERLSVNAMIQETRGATDDLLENYRLLTGYAAVTERLRAELGDVDLRLNHAVTEVQWRAGHVTARVVFADGEYQEEADSLVCTVPTSCFDDLQFRPALFEHAAAARLLPMGDVQKVVFTFKEPLWERPDQVDIDFVHSPGLTFNTRWAWGWVKPFTVTCWAGGARANRLRGMSEDEVVGLALSELSAVVKREVADVRRLVDEIFYHDWVTDTHARGAYTYVAVGGERARAQLGRPVANTLFFAGEATDVSGAPGTVHGAIRAGLRAAQELLGTARV
jgi:monoamine oxidase